MDGEVPFTNLLRRNHHWPFCRAPTLTRLTLTNLTLIPVIMRILTTLFPVTGARINCTDAEPSRDRFVRRPSAAANASGEHVMQYNARKQQVVREIYQRAFLATGLLEK